MAEITEKGYKLKQQNEWFAEERDLYLGIDPAWNLDPSTPDGLKLASDAELYSAFDETLQQAYNARDPNKARGYDLVVLCGLTGTTKSWGTQSTVPLTLIGTPGTVIPYGKRVESETTGSQWYLPQTATLGADGTAIAQGICTVKGQTQADTNTITKIVDTVGGWTGVTNAQVATPGTDEEKDGELRVKRATAVGRPGNNQIDSLYGELYAVSGVRRVKVYENDTDVTDSNGQTKNSYAVIVDGGTDTDVAMAIYLKKNPGTGQYQAGTPVSVTVTSPKYPSNTKMIKFSRPIYVDMNIVITLKNDGTLPSTVGDDIKQAFIDFAAGGLVPADCGFKVSGFDIGEDVPYSTMFTPVNKVIGAYGNSYVQNMTLNGATTNITINWNQLSRWTTSNITVNVV
ncbi:MAG: baseplate J/gp47 family protein [Plesiomonas shigelloides]